MKIKILAVLLALLMLTACSAAPAETTTAPNESQKASQTESVPQEEQESEGTQVESTGESVQDSQSEATEGESSEAEDPSQEQTSEPATTEGVTTQPSVKIYEHYLAALAIYALVFDYPDFQIENIYAASIVPMEQKEQSKGVYVVFESFGSKMTAFVSYIPAERTEPGTSDVYSPEVGFAAFEIVDSVPENLTKIQEADYTAAMSEVSMPSLYTH